tara:strand:+ start:620 stop:724 length:105 start_codon:yes stop_codon:yes gene_type:complete
MDNNRMIARVGMVLVALFAILIVIGYLNPPLAGT